MNWLIHLLPPILCSMIEDWAFATRNQFPSHHLIHLIHHNHSAIASHFRPSFRNVASAHSILMVHVV